MAATISIESLQFLIIIILNLTFIVQNHFTVIAVTLGETQVLFDWLYPKQRWKLSCHDMSRLIKQHWVYLGAQGAGGVGAKFGPSLAPVLMLGSSQYK